MTREKHAQQDGSILTYVAIFGGIAAYIIVSIASWATANLKDAKLATEKERAVMLAEAGSDYYRWHLAHAPLDFQDGTASQGPYQHAFYDIHGTEVGRFTLNISKPATGSTMVTIDSTGTILGAAGVSKAVVTRLAKPSFAKFAVAANDVMRFGSGTEVFGPIHSNKGIRFDGIAHNLITSAVANYDDPDHNEAGTDKREFGVHTHVNAPPSTGISDSYRPNETPPSAMQSRTDVFMTGRLFPVPAIDFDGITNDLSRIKADAQATGFYRGSSGGLAYRVVLKTDDTFDLYKTTGMMNIPGGCNNSASQDGWGVWSIKNQNFIANYPFPANGLIFLEDDVFVEGRIDTARLTIVAAFFPETSAVRKSIIVNNDLSYTNYDGQDVISLIAQKNITVGLISDNDLRIDAALVAQKGRVGRFYYDNDCVVAGTDYSHRSQLTLWGMIASNQRYGFAYTDGSGYAVRLINYDANLLYSPPPSFPLVTDQYQTMSWEVK